MKRYLLASAALAALTVGPALAADLPVRRQAPVAAPVAIPVAAYNWSGFYIGAHGGGAWGDHCFDLLGVDRGCHDNTGWVAGGQVGVNWQSGQWVFGLEFSGAAADLDGNHNDVLGGAFNSRVDSLFMLTGRVGIAWSNILAYVTGGGAWVHNRHDITLLGGTASVRDDRWGWTIGGGLEFGFAPNWSLALQYNFVHLDEESTNFTFAVPATFNIDQEMHVATVRLNYRFGGMARY